jgi:hypothetical protein
MEASTGTPKNETKTTVAHALSDEQGQGLLVASRTRALGGSESHCPSTDSKSQSRIADFSDSFTTTPATVDDAPRSAKGKVQKPIYARSIL